MNISSILFGCLFALLFGAMFHLWRGGTIKRFVLYQILSWAGFWIFDILASLLKWTFLSVGQLHLGMATLGAISFLFIGEWLSKSKNESKK
jgi:hypothetical protein